MAGDQRYLPAGGADPDAGGERSYWDLDRRLKLAESAAGSTVSATGAIYAIRRELFEPVRTGRHRRLHHLDGSHRPRPAARVRARGRRLGAGAPVEPTRVRPQGPDHDPRAARRRRSGATLLDPRRTGFYAVQLASHKILRRLMAVPLLVVAAGAAVLWPRGRSIGSLRSARRRLTASGAARVGSAAVTARPAAAGSPWPRSSSSSTSPRSRRCYNLLTGRRIDRWEPRSPRP